MSPTSAANSAFDDKFAGVDTVKLKKLGKQN
jgi:hypothetical protein